MASRRLDRATAPTAISFASKYTGGVGDCPFDMNVCPAREIGMGHQEGPFVAVKERMRVRKQTHHVAWVGFHGAGVEAEVESMLDGPPYTNPQ